jgi:urease accessory protein
MGTVAPIICQALWSLRVAAIAITTAGIRPSFTIFSIPMLPQSSVETSQPLAHQAFLMLRLASPMLPIGGFSYSQGLEQAIERGWVVDEASTQSWIEGVLQCSFAQFEAPLVWKACAEPLHAERLNALYCASREAAELLAETLQMGFSLAQMLEKFAPLPRWAAQARDAEALSLPGAWSIAAEQFGLSPDAALQAYLFSWLENQIMVALKAVPLGQQAGQRLLHALLPELTRIARHASTLQEREWSNFAPGLAMASSWHEIQYSRMFRS